MAVDDDDIRQHLELARRAIIDLRRRLDRIEQHSVGDSQRLRYRTAPGGRQESKFRECGSIDELTRNRK